MSETPTFDAARVRAHPAYLTFTGRADAHGVAGGLDVVGERWPELDRCALVDLAVAYSLPRARELGAANGATTAQEVITKESPPVAPARCIRLWDTDQAAWYAQYGPPAGPLSGYWAGTSTPGGLLHELGLQRLLIGDPVPASARADWVIHDEQARREVCQAYVTAWRSGRDQRITEEARRLARARGRVKPWHEDIPAADLKPGDLIQTGTTTYVLAARVETNDATVAVWIYDGITPRTTPTLFYQAGATVTLSVFYR